MRLSIHGVTIVADFGTPRAKVVAIIAHGNTIPARPLDLNDADWGEKQGLAECIVQAFNDSDARLHFNQGV